MVASLGFIYVAYELLVSIYQHQKTKCQMSDVILWVGLLVWFWLDAFSLAWSDTAFAIHTNLSPFSNSTFPNIIVAVGLFQIALFQTSMIFGLFIFSNLSIKFRFSSIKVMPDWTLNYALLILSLLGWLTFYIYSDNLFQTIIMFRQSGLEMDEGFLTYLPIISIVAGGWALAIIMSSDHRTGFVIVFVFLAGSSLAFFSGTRFKMLYVMMPSLICITHVFLCKKLTYKNIVSMLVFAFFMVGLFSYQFMTRFQEDV